MNAHTTTTANEGSNVPRWHAALTSVINAKEETDTAPLVILNAAGMDTIETWPEREAAVKRVMKPTTNGKMVARKDDWYKARVLDTAVGKELDGQLTAIKDAKLNGPEARARKDTLNRKIGYAVETMKRAKDCVISMQTLGNLGFPCKVSQISGKASKSFRPFMVGDTSGERQEYFSVPELLKASKLEHLGDARIIGKNDDGKESVATNVQLLRAALKGNRDRDNDGGKNVNFKSWKNDCLPAAQGLVNYFDDADRIRALTKNKLDKEQLETVVSLFEGIGRVIAANSMDADKVDGLMAQIEKLVVNPPLNGNGNKEPEEALHAKQDEEPANVRNQPPVAKAKAKGKAKAKAH